MSPVTHAQLFVTLLLSALLGINGTREIWYGNFAMGALMYAIPICYWVTVWWVPS